MSRTGVLIVTHNSASHIGRCLDALRDQPKVLVVDNASTDATAAAVAGRNGVRYVQNTDNAGFAGAVNQGFRLFPDDVDQVLLLNPDVVMTGGFGELSSACERAGLAAGRLTDVNSSTQIGFSLRRFPSPVTLLFETIGWNRLAPWNSVNRRYRCLDVDHAVAGEVEQPAGAMLMIRKDVWTRLNGFDEGFYPVWFEDVDFCRRAYDLGIRAAYVPSVAGVHEGGHSVLQIPNRDRRRYWYASLMRYSRKHFGRFGWGLVAAGVVAASLVRFMGAVLRLHDGCFEEAEMYWIIVRTTFVRAASGPDEKEGMMGSANVRGCLTNDGQPSTENTERTLKRLHAR
jgi:GT2 family glycosyltransferase